jgi:hypothetical protein
VDRAQLSVGYHKVITAEYIKGLIGQLNPPASAELTEAINQLCDENARLMSDLIRTKRETWKKDQLVKRAYGRPVQFTS